MGQTIHQESLDPEGDIVCQARWAHHILSNGGSDFHLIYHTMVTGPWTTLSHVGVVSLVKLGPVRASSASGALIQISWDPIPLRPVVAWRYSSSILLIPHTKTWQMVLHHMASILHTHLDHLSKRGCLENE